MAYVITSPCIGEKSSECQEVCPVDCIEEGEDKLHIDPDVCIDCGACEEVCPVEAIYAEEDVPESEQSYVEINRKFFE